MAIRFDKRLNREIRRVVRNYNQKIARLQNLENENLILPEKVKVKEIKTAGSRRELRRKLKSLERFSKKGSYEIENSGISRYEYGEIKRESARLKRNLTREIREYGETTPTIFGKKQAGTFKEMGSTRLRNLEIKRKALDKDILKLSKSEISQYKNYLNKISYQTENLNFRDNYYDMLFNLAYEYGYPSDKIEMIKSKINLIPKSKFNDFFEKEQSIKAVIDYYDQMIKLVKGAKNKNQKELYNNIKSDVFNLFDNIYDNITEMTSDYV